MRSVSRDSAESSSERCDEGHGATACSGDRSGLRKRQEGNGRSDADRLPARRDFEGCRATQRRHAGAGPPCERVGASETELKSQAGVEQNVVNPCPVPRCNIFGPDVRSKPARW
jgi:hypothetical protein